MKLANMKIGQKTSVKAQDDSPIAAAQVWLKTNSSALKTIEKQLESYSIKFDKEVKYGLDDQGVAVVGQTIFKLGEMLHNLIDGHYEVAANSMIRQARMIKDNLV